MLILVLESQDTVLPRLVNVDFRRASTERESLGNTSTLIRERPFRLADEPREKGHRRYGVRAVQEGTWKASSFHASRAEFGESLVATSCIGLSADTVRSVVSTA